MENNENKNENNIIKIKSVFDALKTDLILRLKKFRDNNDTEFCIIDRISSAFFIDIFRDSLYKYEKNAVLCERLFFKEKCKSAPVQSLKLSNDSKKLIEEFIQFSNNLPDAKDLSEEEQNEITTKLNDYQEKIKEIKPETEEKNVLFYNDEETITRYLVTPLKELSDESIEYISVIIANFVCSYYQAMNYSLDLSKSIIDVIGIEYDDFVDIVIVVK